MKNIIEKIEEAVASKKTSEENKKLLLEAKEELIKAKTEKRIIQIIAIIIKIITGFSDD
jgi:hypothetical protein